MDSELITILINAGTAGVVVILLLTKQLVPGWLYKKQEKEITALKRGREYDRERAEAATSAATTTNLLLGALRDLAVSGRSIPPPSPSPGNPGAGRDPAGTWKDIS